MVFHSHLPQIEWIHMLIKMGAIFRLYRLHRQLLKTMLDVIRGSVVCFFFVSFCLLFLFYANQLGIIWREWTKMIRSSMASLYTYTVQQHGPEFIEKEVPKKKIKTFAARDKREAIQCNDDGTPCPVTNGFLHYLRHIFNLHHPFWVAAMIAILIHMYAFHLK